MSKNKNTIKFKDIKTPKTIKEFRENLNKYFVGFKDRIYTYGEQDLITTSLKTMSDVYDRDGNWSWNGSDHHYPPLSMTPTIVFTKKDKSNKKYLSETEILWSEDCLSIEKNCYDFWNDEDNYTIFESDDNSFIDYQLKIHKEVYWIPYWKSNSLYREYYQKTLGKYSGWGTYKNKKKDRKFEFIKENN